MSTTKTPAFLDDAPKHEPEEDRLGRRVFAERLANALLAINPPNGYVVGVQGPWGGGKSTALNFVKAYLARSVRKRDVVVLDFAPWLISGQQDLIRGFFKVLSEAVDRSATRRQSAKKAVAQSASSVVDPVFQAVGTLVAALNPGVGEAIKPAADVGAASTRAALENWAKDPSLQQAHEGLRKALQKDRRRFIVFIDDIDRLDDEDIRAVARLVKSVGGLPKVTYVLAYDRAILRRALDGDRRGRPGPSYDEKIIQHEVNLPASPPGTLTKLLGENIDFMIGNTPDSMRWQMILHHGLDRWLKSMRDVVRLSNAVIFASPALNGELDHQDLLAMEGIRIFDPTAFDWLRDHRDFLLSESRSLLRRKEAVERSVKALHASLPKGERDDILALLCALFPGRAKELALNEKAWFSSGEPPRSVTKRRGIATADGFTAYFSLSGEAVEVSKADIDELIDDLTDDQRIAETFDKYLNRRDGSDRSLITALLSELVARFDGGERVTQKFLNSILRIGERVLVLDQSEDGGFSSKPFIAYTMLVNSMLESVKLKKAGEMLARAFEGPVSPAIAADIYVDRARELGVLESHSATRGGLIFQADLEKIGPPLLAKIEAAAMSGELSSAPRYWNIVRVWKHLGVASDAQKWIRHEAESSADNFSKIALGFLAYSVGGKGQYYFLHDRPSGEDFSLEELNRLAEKHRGSASTDNANAQIEALREGTRKMLLDENLMRVDPQDDSDEH